MTPLTADAGTLAQAVREREVSSRELVEGYLDRIDRLNPAINAVVTLDADRARAAAAGADAATARGDELGPLHGIPFTIKDAIEVGGVRSTGGSVALTDHVPDADAPAVARLRAAGGILLGKTNGPEWSMDLQTYNAVFGTTSNPWDTGRVPGGSSGGSAAAVSAALSAFDIGTDIGGSIRLPAHFCGVYGLKPSYGVVPQRGYLDHVGGGTTDADINVFGPLARSAADLDLLLGVLAGPEPERELGWSLQLPASRRADVGAFRVGTWFETPELPTDREVLDVLRRAADALAGAGAVVEEAHPPVSFGEQLQVFTSLIGPAVSVCMPEEIGDAFGGSHRSWLATDERRAALRRVWAGWFEQYDVLLCPAAPIAAFTHRQDGDLTSRTIEIDGTTHAYVSTDDWNGLIGVLGLPSAVAPVGLTSAGLPVGVQVVAAYLRDREAVHLAEILGDLTGGYRSPPGFG